MKWMSSTLVCTLKKKNSPQLSYEGNKFFSSPKTPDQLWGIPSLPGVEHLVHEANDTPPGSAKVKNVWNYTTNLQYAIMTRIGTTTFTSHFKPNNLNQCRSQWPHSLRRRSAATRQLSLWVRIPPGAWMFVVRERSLWRAEPSSSGVLPTVVRCYEWSRNLVNEDLAHWGLLRGGTNPVMSNICPLYLAMLPVIQFQKQQNTEHSTNNNLAAFIQKYYSMSVITKHTFHTKIYIEVPCHIKVTTALLGFLTYRFSNCKVKWWLDVTYLTTQHVSLIYIEMYKLFVSVTFHDICFNHVWS